MAKKIICRKYIHVNIFLKGILANILVFFYFLSWNIFNHIVFLQCGKSRNGFSMANSASLNYRDFLLAIGRKRLRSDLSHFPRLSSSVGGIMTLPGFTTIFGRCYNMRKAARQKAILASSAWLIFSAWSVTDVLQKLCGTVVSASEHIHTDCLVKVPKSEINTSYLTDFFYCLLKEMHLFDQKYRCIFQCSKFSM